LGVLVIGLIEAGVIAPPLDLERTYSNRRLRARIERDGRVTCMGREFATLSSAATFARSTCPEPLSAESHRISNNGWTFWQFRDENGRLESVGGLRKRFLRESTGQVDAGLTRPSGSRGQSD
jgi:hypothetical protein